MFSKNLLLLAAVIIYLIAAASKVYAGAYNTCPGNVLTLTDANLGSSVFSLPAGCALTVENCQGSLLFSTSVSEITLKIKNHACPSMTASSSCVVFSSAVSGSIQIDGISQKITSTDFGEFVLVRFNDALSVNLLSLKRFFIDATVTSNSAVGLYGAYFASTVTASGSGNVFNFSDAIVAQGGRLAGANAECAFVVFKDGSHLQDFEIVELTNNTVAGSFQVSGSAGFAFLFLISFSKTAKLTLSGTAGASLVLKKNNFTSAFVTASSSSASLVVFNGAGNCDSSVCISKIAKIIVDQILMNGCVVMSMTTSWARLAVLFIPEGPQLQMWGSAKSIVVRGVQMSGTLMGAGDSSGATAALVVQLGPTASGVNGMFVKTIEMQTVDVDVSVLDNPMVAAGGATSSAFVAILHLLHGVPYITSLSVTDTTIRGTIKTKGPARAFLVYSHNNIAAMGTGAGTALDVGAHNVVSASLESTGSWACYGALYVPSGYTASNFETISSETAALNVQSSASPSATSPAPGSGSIQVFCGNGVSTTAGPAGTPAPSRSSVVTMTRTQQQQQPPREVSQTQTVLPPAPSSAPPSSVAPPPSSSAAPPSPSATPAGSSWAFFLKVEDANGCTNCPASFLLASSGTIAGYVIGNGLAPDTANTICRWMGHGGYSSTTRSWKRPPLTVTVRNLYCPSTAGSLADCTYEFIDAHHETTQLVYTLTCKAATTTPTPAAPTTAAPSCTTKHVVEVACNADSNCIWNPIDARCATACPLRFSKASCTANDASYICVWGGSACRTQCAIKYQQGNKVGCLSDANCEWVYDDGTGQGACIEPCRTLSQGDCMHTGGCKYNAGTAMCGTSCSGKYDTAVSCTTSSSMSCMWSGDPLACHEACESYTSQIECSMPMTQGAATCTWTGTACKTPCRYKHVTKDSCNADSSNCIWNPNAAPVCVAACSSYSSQMLCPGGICLWNSGTGKCVAPTTTTTLAPAPTTTTTTTTPAPAAPTTTTSAASSPTTTSAALTTTMTSTTAASTAAETCTGTTQEETCQQKGCSWTPASCVAPTTTTTSSAAMATTSSIIAAGTTSTSLSTTAAAASETTSSSPSSSAPPAQTSSPTTAAPTTTTGAPSSGNRNDNNRNFVSVVSITITSTEAKNFNKTDFIQKLAGLIRWPAADLRASAPQKGQKTRVSVVIMGRNESAVDAAALRAESLNSGELSSLGATAVTSGGSSAAAADDGSSGGGGGGMSDMVIVAGVAGLVVGGVVVGVLVWLKMRKAARSGGGYGASGEIETPLSRLVEGDQHVSFELGVNHRNPQI